MGFIFSLPLTVEWTHTCQQHQGKGTKRMVGEWAVVEKGIFRPDKGRWKEWLGHSLPQHSCICLTLNLFSSAVPLPTPMTTGHATEIT